MDRYRPRWRETELCLISALVVESCCQGDRNHKMSLLYGPILPSVHLCVIKTASNVLHVKEGKENECRLLEKSGDGTEGRWN